jgi:hypothetical protein
MKRWLISAAVVAGVIVSAGPAAAAPPGPVDATFTSSDCGFDVEIHILGKTKTIDLGDGRFIVPAPGQEATLRATASDETVEYVVTGIFFQQVLADGSVEVTATGRNILIRPGIGLFLTTGNFNFAVAADGSELRPFAGSGQVVSICEALT